MKKNNSKKEKSGLYIAICCCAVIIAAVGYAGNQNQKNINNDELIKTQSAAKNSTMYEDVHKDEYVSDEIIFTESEVYDTEDENIGSELKENEISNTITETEIPVEKTVVIEEGNDEFIFPVDGKIINKYSDNELIFNEILQDWRTHNGIDIKCSNGAKISAAQSGVVVDIYDDLLGTNIVIEHDDGYKSVYANLSQDVEVSIGDVIEKGNIIGKAGETALADFTKESHLHFELLCDEKYLNPEKYLKN